MASQPLPSSRRWLILAAVWASALLVIWPVLRHWTAPDPTRSATLIACALAVLAAAALAGFFLRAEAKRLDRAEVVTLLLFVFLLTGLLEYSHHFFVDHGFYFGSAYNNQVWQQQMQHDIVRLDPVALPHSYRFLPNAVVFWMQLGHVSFRAASEIYRSLTMLVLFYAIYRFARLFTTHLGGLFAMLLVGVVYPVSFVAYAGQLTDPLSHLSFLLAFIFLETDEFLFFLSALLIGSLAKETVLGMLGFYVLFARKTRDYLWKAPLVVLTCLAAYFGVRTFVLHGMMGYQQVSGVNMAFILTNLGQKIWVPHFLLTGLAYIPFLLLGWKTTPLMLKRLSFYLLPLLLLSSMIFSWLNEARNYMPLVFVLAVVAARYLIQQKDQPQVVSTYSLRPESGDTLSS